MDEHLSKPVDIAMLERAVRKYLVTPPRKRETVNPDLPREPLNAYQKKDRTSSRQFCPFCVFRSKIGHRQPRAAGSSISAAE